MGTRRAYGTGSVTQRADGRWVGRIEAGWNANGKRRRITVSDMDEDKCKAKLRKKLREVMAEKPEALAAKMTVKAWADKWLPEHQKHVRPNVYVTDRGLIMKWIVPTIGTRNLGDLRPADARKVETAILEAGLSSTTARAAISKLRTMLKAARVEGYPVPDGIFEMKRPAMAPSTRDAIPVDDAKKLLRKADGTPDLARWILALYQALRQGEALGLEWDRVDLDNGTLDIAWQLQPLPRDKDAGRIVFPEGMEARHVVDNYYLLRPKTSKGRRMVPLSPMAWAALKAWREVAPENEWGLVFTLPDNRRMRGREDSPRPRHKGRDRALWYALQDEAGVRRSDGGRYTLHEARHTTASLLLEANVDPHVVTAIMGHSSIVTSRGYMHVATELARKALTDVGAMLDYRMTDDAQQQIEKGTP